jgi:hypothetical protein
VAKIAALVTFLPSTSILVFQGKISARGRCLYPLPKLPDESSVGGVALPLWGV